MKPNACACLTSAGAPILTASCAKTVLTDFIKAVTRLMSPYAPDSKLVTGALPIVSDAGPGNVVCVVATPVPKAPVSVTTLKVEPGG